MYRGAGRVEELTGGEAPGLLLEVRGIPAPGHRGRGGSGPGERGGSGPGEGLLMRLSGVGAGRKWDPPPRPLSPPISASHCPPHDPGPQPVGRSSPSVQSGGQGQSPRHRTGNEWTWEWGWSFLCFSFAVLRKSLVFSEPQFLPLWRSGGYSLLRCTGFSLWWLLLLRSMGSRPTGFSSCGTRAQ